MGKVGNTLASLSGVISGIWCILFLASVVLRMGPFAWKPIIPCMFSCCYGWCGPALAKFIPF